MNNITTYSLYSYNYFIGKEYHYRRAMKYILERTLVLTVLKPKQSQLVVDVVLNIIYHVINK